MVMAICIASLTAIRTSLNKVQIGGTFVGKSGGTFVGRRDWRF